MTDTDSKKYEGQIPTEFILTTEKFISYFFHEYNFNSKFASKNLDIQEFMSFGQDNPIFESIPDLKTTNFTEYLPDPILKQQINEGKLLVGRLNINRLMPNKATLRVYGLDAEIYIDGEQYLNRATNFDTVAVQILPESSIFYEIEYNF